MPELPEVYTALPPLPVCAIGAPLELPPPLDPAEWEDFAVFRETFLAYFTRPEDAAAFRLVGSLIFEMLLEHVRYFPDPPESSVRWELRAALADLRHLQGFFRTLGNQRKASSLDAQDAALSRYAGLQSAKVRRLADRIADRLERS